MVGRKGSGSEPVAGGTWAFSVMHVCCVARRQEDPLHLPVGKESWEGGKGAKGPEAPQASDFALQYGVVWVCSAGLGLPPRWLSSQWRERPDAMAVEGWGLHGKLPQFPRKWEFPGLRPVHPPLHRGYSKVK